MLSIAAERQKKNNDRDDLYCTVLDESFSQVFLA